MSNKKDGYIHCLDGIRAVSMIMIFMFHNWQQSWITIQIPYANGKYLLNLDIVQRMGYIAIDIFFVLSGFCLFYHYARAMFGEAKERSVKDYYISRARRILPGYYLMLIMLLIFPKLSYGAYDPTKLSDLIQQFGSHALFLFGLSNKTAGTVISTAWMIWTQVMLYIAFPLLIIPFKKKPVLTFVLYAVVSFAARLYLVGNADFDDVTRTNPLVYLDLFAMGMLCAYFVVKTKHSPAKMDKLKIPMTIISVLCIVGIYCYMKWMSTANLPDYDGSAYFRYITRGIAGVLISLFIYSTVFSCGFWEEKVWGNKVFVFLSTISFSFFLWHQNIHIFLKRINIPYSEMNPVMKDRAAMDGFVFLSIVLSLAIACASTYLVERPIAKYGFKGYLKMIEEKMKRKKEIEL